MQLKTVISIALLTLSTPCLAASQVCDSTGTCIIQIAPQSSVDVTVDNVMKGPDSYYSCLVKIEGFRKGLKTDYGQFEKIGVTQFTFGKTETSECFSFHAEKLKVPKANIVVNIPCTNGTAPCAGIMYCTDSHMFCSASD